MKKEWTSAEEIDAELRELHRQLGPRWRHNDPRFSEDLPDWMMYYHLPLQR